MRKDSTGNKKRDRKLLLILVLVLLILIVCIYDGLRDDITKAEYPKNYSVYVEKYATQYQIPVHLLYAVIHTESGFDSSAVSPVGATGLMQLMPTTFRWLSDDMLGEHLADGMIYDPETNIRYGCYYLSLLFARYNNWESTLAAYNAGPSRVDRWLSTDGMTDEEGVLIPEKIPDPYGETRRYVPKVLKAKQAYDTLYPVNQEKN
jgi:soluble lytic murein transglycosylase